MLRGYDIEDSEASIVSDSHSGSEENSGETEESEDEEDSEESEIEGNDIPDEQGIVTGHVPFNPKQTEKDPKSSDPHD